jgi:hypothetical protein
VHIARPENVFLSQEASEQKPVTKRVDASRNTSCERMDQVEAVGLERRVVLPVNVLSRCSMYACVSALPRQPR